MRRSNDTAPLLEIERRKGNGKTESKEERKLSGRERRKWRHYVRRRMRRRRGVMGIRRRGMSHLPPRFWTCCIYHLSF